MCYSLLKYWCPSPSSKAPLIHPPHCSEVPAYKHTGTVREISSMGSRVGQGRWQRTGCRTCIAWVKGQYVPSVLSQNSDLTIQSEMKGRSPIFCCICFGTARGGWQHAEERITCPWAWSWWKCTPHGSSALKEQPTVLLDTGKACQCKAITTAESHLGTNLAQQPCCLWLTDTQILLEIEVCMTISDMYLVRCQGLSFTLHKTFWSITQQRYQSQEVNFENKCEESLEKEIGQKLVKNALGWLSQCFKFGIFLPN